MNLFSIICLLLMVQLVQAQTDTVYLTADFEFVSDPEKTQYVRIITGINEDGTCIVADYLKTGEKMHEGSVSFLNSSAWRHKHTFYYPTGVIKYLGVTHFTKKNLYRGFSAKEFYPNSQLRSEVIVSDNQEKYLSAFDSLGNSTIKNGLGYATNESFYEKKIWKGFVKNFVPDSVWVCIDTQTGTIAHEEWYKEGKFLRGLSFTNQTEVSYTKISESINIDLISDVESQLKKIIKHQTGQKAKRGSYSFGLEFIDGKPTRVVQLFKSINTKAIALDSVKIPQEMFFIERGIPVKHQVLIINL